MTRRSGICAWVAGALLAAGLSVSLAQAEEPKAYTAVLVNNFMGNSWRALMERSAQLLIDQPPLKGRISDLRIINTDNTAAAQNAVISNLILEKPDILLLEAASTTASNQVIQQACDAGIVVITYDQLAEAPCAWKLAPDFTRSARSRPSGWPSRWAARARSSSIWALPGHRRRSTRPRARIRFRQISRHQAGAPTIPTSPRARSRRRSRASFRRTLTSPAILRCMPRAYALDALKAAGHAPVPITGYSFAEGILKCQKEQLTCLFKSVPAWVSSSALILGVDILDGKVTGDPRFVLMDTPWITNTDLKGVYDGPSPVMTLNDGGRGSRARHHAAAVAALGQARSPGGAEAAGHRVTGAALPGAGRPWLRSCGSAA